jgi:hypothetical protein
MCVCGHTAGEHHVSWFPGGAIIIEECEAEGVGYWTEHCPSFVEARMEDEK